MTLLYSLLFLMLVIAILLLAIPFIKNKSASIQAFLMIALIMIVFAGGLYSLTSNHAALEEWLLHGKEHYQLLLEYQQLGGLEGLITKVNAKVKENPNDAQGWYILGKLYLMKQDLPNARKALEKAHQLKPADGQIEYFYRMTEGK